MSLLKMATAQDVSIDGGEEQPHQVIVPTSGWSALNLGQVWLYRDLLFTLAQRDVKLRYRQTALGAVWVVLQPLLAAGVFSLVFGALAGFSEAGVPAIVFSFAGLLGWNIFSSTLNKVSGVLIQNSQLISKVYFPRLVLPLSTVYSTVIDFCVSAVMMVLLMLVFHIWPGWGILLLPVWICLILMMSVGIGLFAAALTVSYRDVQYVIPVMMNLLLYASPVAYSLSTVMERLDKNLPQYADIARIFFMANPLSGLLEAFRISLLGNAPMPWGLILYSSIVSILVFLGGAFSFKKMERKFADVI
jgi:lipopolysaccharide transport system permease protein